MEDLHHLLNWNGSSWLNDSTEVASTHRNDTARPHASSATFGGRRCDQVTQFAISSIGAGILCALGLLGNGISFAILSQDRTTSPVATFLLQSLSLADSLFLVVWFLQFSLDSFFRFFGIDRAFSVAYSYSRTYTYPLAFVAQTATVWLTVLIAASRYVAVCLPYKASSFCTVAVTRRAAVAVAVFSVVYNLPRFFENEIASTVNRRNMTRLQLRRSPVGSSVVYQAIYFDALYYVFSFVLPLILLLVFNFRLIVAYRAVQKRRSEMKLRRPPSSRRSTATESHEHNITLVMIVVILVFMLCNAPARVVQIVLRYAVQPCPSVAHFVVLLANALEVFGSSSNFLVYCGFRKQFRRTMLWRLRKACAASSHSYARSRDPSDQTTVNRTESPPPPPPPTDRPPLPTVLLRRFWIEWSERMDGGVEALEPGSCC